MIIIILLNFGKDMKNMSYEKYEDLNKGVNRELATFVGCSFVGCITAFFMVLFIIWFISWVF